MTDKTKKILVWSGVALAITGIVFFVTSSAKGSSTTGGTKQMLRGGAYVQNGNLYRPNGDLVHTGVSQVNSQGNVYFSNGEIMYADGKVYSKNDDFMYSIFV